MRIQSFRQLIKFVDSVGLVSEFAFMKVKVCSIVTLELFFCAQTETADLVGLISSASFEMNHNEVTFSSNFKSCIEIKTSIQDQRGLPNLPQSLAKYEIISLSLSLSVSVSLSLSEIIMYILGSVSLLFPH